jgi:hypothetical protein
MSVNDAPIRTAEIVFLLQTSDPAQQGPLEQAALQLLQTYAALLRAR